MQPEPDMQDVLRAAKALRALPDATAELCGWVADIVNDGSLFQNPLAFRRCDALIVAAAGPQSADSRRLRWDAFAATLGDDIYLPRRLDVASEKEGFLKHGAKTGFAHDYMAGRWRLADAFRSGSRDCWSVEQLQDIVCVLLWGHGGEPGHFAADLQAFLAALDDEDKLRRLGFCSARAETDSREPLAQ